MTERPGAPPGSSYRQIAKRLEAASWGVFFIWVGYALLMNVSLGVGLVGVGVITLLAQAARGMFSLPFEGFWLLIGAGFLLAGLWNVYAVEIPFAPVMLLGVGVLLLGAALLRRGDGDSDD